MNYISTRGNSEPVTSAQAINLGMVPQGGLFIPESIPTLDPVTCAGLSYQDTAKQVLSRFLTDYSEAELQSCIDHAYNLNTFGIDSVVGLHELDSQRSVLELWHGPTAAFKDVALQIMPEFLKVAKQKLGVTSHTVILVATSGDTGKAALEGFKNRDGISIIVFYPDEGVSAIQKLQMTTTDGSNTHVAAVKGNFDDCQTAVKQLFGNSELIASLAEKDTVFSSANSINWGRLCPQIVYYYHSYQMLAEVGRIKMGDPIYFCVPTGNFGNILAAWYAKRMGLPIKKLICASNTNNVLTDFFTTGCYDRNRNFHKTMSPSMDILISSNLERFLFEVSGHNAEAVNQWYSDMQTSGSFTVDADVKAAMDAEICASWVNEDVVLQTITETFKQNNYCIDPHTAVAVAAQKALELDDAPVIIDSTASPYKFSGNICRALDGADTGDEFASIERISELTQTPVHPGLAGLQERTVHHQTVITVDKMRETVLGFLGL